MQTHLPVFKGKVSPVFPLIMLPFPRFLTSQKFSLQYRRSRHQKCFVPPRMCHITLREHKTHKNLESTQEKMAIILKGKKRTE